PGSHPMLATESYGFGGRRVFHALPVRLSSVDNVTRPRPANAHVAGSGIDGGRQIVELEAAGIVHLLESRGGERRSPVSPNIHISEQFIRILPAIWVPAIRVCASARSQRIQQSLVGHRQHWGVPRIQRKEVVRVRGRPPEAEISN